MLAKNSYKRYSFIYVDDEIGDNECVGHHAHRKTFELAFLLRR